MKRMLLAACCISALGVSAHVSAQEWAGYDNRWYVGVAGGATRLATSRLTDSSSFYYGAYLGRFFSPNFSLDLQIDSYSTDFRRRELVDAGLNPAFGGSDFDIYGYGLAGRWHFLEESARHRPFLLLGVGIQEHDNFVDDGRDLYASGGVGLQSKLGNNWRLRSQLEVRYDNERDTRADKRTNEGFFDVIASFGLGYSFGEPPRPPAPPAAPAAAPAPRPAPPPPPPPPAPEPEVLFEFDSMVFFAFDSAVLKDSALAELNDAANILSARNELVLIEVAGHTDSIGDEDYNQGLSERRAQSVADYLVSRGIARNRLQVVGFGETRPKLPNTTPENRAQNRRVVLSVLDRR
jgi:OOP family OmpA-OmpF porin